MNKKQRTVLLLAIIAFLVSILYVPETAVFSGGQNIHLGWQLILDLTYDINIKILIMEWVGLVVICVGLIIYLKDSSE